MTKVIKVTRLKQMSLITMQDSLKENKIRTKRRKRKSHRLKESFYQVNIATKENQQSKGQLL